MFFRACALAFQALPISLRRSQFHTYLIKPIRVSSDTSLIQRERKELKRKRQLTRHSLGQIPPGRQARILQDLGRCCGYQHQ